MDFCKLKKAAGRVFLLLAVALPLIVSGCGGGGSSSTPVPVITYGSVRITNYTSSTIMYAYLSPTGASTWGVDQLGSSTIATGTSFTITSVPTGTYDLWVKFANGTNGYSYAFSVSSGVTTTVTFGTATGTVRINNVSSSTIDAAYLSPTSSSTWGSNQITTSIANGNYRDIINVPPDQYDFRAHTINGLNHDLLNFTVSAGGTFTVNVTP